MSIIQKDKNFAVNILVIEDDTDFRHLLLRRITRMGHNAVGIGNGIEAIEIFQNDKFDLLIVDLNLPGKSGLEVIQALRINHPDLQVIVISGTGTLETAIEAMRQGVYDYLPKPLESLAVFEMAVKRALRDVKQKQLNQELFEEVQYLSITDPLTGLYNRRVMTDMLKEKLTAVKKTETSLSLIMFDLDNFKSINDQAGHIVGDKVLSAISNIVKECIDTHDVAIRYGGDEFLILLPDKKIEVAKQLCTRVKEGVESLNINDLSISLSFGVAEWGDKYKNGEDFIKAADRELYKAKQEKNSQFIKKSL